MPDGMFCHRCGARRVGTSTNRGSAAELGSTEQALAANGPMLQALRFSEGQVTSCSPFPGQLIDHSTASAETISLTCDAGEQQSNESDMNWLEWVTLITSETPAEAGESHFIRQDWNFDDMHLAPQNRTWPGMRDEATTGSAIPTLPCADEPLTGDSPDLCNLM